MGINDVVTVLVSLASAVSLSVQSFGVPMLAVSHNNYPDRFRTYSAQGGTGLAQMVKDGFPTTSAAYKEATVLCAQPGLGTFGIGKRMLAPQQSLQLTCTDGTVGDGYAFSLVGTDGKTTNAAYTNIPSVGAVLAGGSALTGNVTLTPGSTAVTFATAQTLTAGQTLKFSTQTSVAYVVAAATSSSTSATLTTIYTGPASTSATATPGATVATTNGSTAVTFSAAQTLLAGAILYIAGVPYVLSANVTSSTSGTLATSYAGATAAAAAITTLAPLGGTFGVTNGSATVSTSSTQVGTVLVGDSVQFASQLGTYYQVASLTSAAITLTTPYQGNTAGSTTATDICTASAAATYLWAQLAGVANVGTVTVSSAVISIARTDGGLTDVLGWLDNGLNTMQLADITADPGIATDLAAILAANPIGWYGFALDSNSPAEVKAAATWANGTGQGGKMFFANTSDSGVYNSTVTTDIFSVMQTNGTQKAVAWYNGRQLLNYTGAGFCGWALGQHPGTYAFAEGATLNGVPADNDATLPESSRIVINSRTATSPNNGGKGGNFYCTVAGKNMSFWGYVGGGEWADVEIFIDYIQGNAQANVANVLASLPKVPYTDGGIGLLGDALYNTLAAEVKVNGIQGGIDGSVPIVLTKPTAASIPASVRATRNLTGLAASGKLSGAIVTANVAIALTQ